MPRIQYSIENGARLQGPACVLSAPEPVQLRPNDGIEHSMDTYSLDSLALFLERAHERYLTQERPQAASTQVRSGTGTNAVPEDLDAHRQLWEQLAGIMDCEQTVTGVVTGWNRGGLLVRWKELQGFVPASQLADVPVFGDESSRDEILSRWLGDELLLKVIELDPSRNRLVLSERAASWGPGQGEELLSRMTVGDVYEGTVSNVCDFGAFVDLGGIDGLIHISEISWGRVTHPSAFLKIGDSVRVLVLSIDREHHHIGLSIKRLQENPWMMVDVRYGIGDLVEAEVTNLVDFGAFVQLEEGLEGLVHISELAEEHVEHPSEVVRVGERVQVRVLRIEKEQHRLSLSLRQAAGDGDHSDGDSGVYPVGY